MKCEIEKQNKQNKVNGYIQGSDAMKRVQDEISVIKKWNHPNIIGYYGHTFSTNHAVLFFEFVHIGSLRDVIDQIKSGLDIITLQNFIQQLASAIGKYFIFNFSFLFLCLSSFLFFF